MPFARPLPGVHGQQVPAASDISTTNLVAFWRMNEGTGTSVSSETGNHSGTTYNSPTWVTGKSGTALSFNGTSQYVGITKTTALDVTASAISLMAWVNPTTTAGIRRILNLPYSETGGNEKYSILINAGTFQCLLKNTSGSGLEDGPSFAFTTTGSWSHLCAVYNGSNILLYINGSAVGTPYSRIGPVVASINGDVQIGRFGPTWGQYFSGVIDDVRIYSRAITATEVGTVYSLG